MAPIGFPTWSCSRRNGPTLILSGGIVCRVCTVWPKRRKRLLRPWLFLQTCSPRAGSVGFFYNFLKRTGYAKRPWFLTTRCLIVYYELLTYCRLGAGNGCGTITALIGGMTNISNKTLLALMIGAASLAVFGPLASANTMQLTLDYGSRHSGNGGEFNASSPDFVPGTTG